MKKKTLTYVKTSGISYVYPINGADSNSLGGLIINGSILKEIRLSEKKAQNLDRQIVDNKITANIFIDMSAAEIAELLEVVTIDEAQNVLDWLRGDIPSTIIEKRDEPSFSAAAAEPQVALLEQKPEVIVAGDCEDLS